jgi:hypothetical protein
MGTTSEDKGQLIEVDFAKKVSKPKLVPKSPDQ